MARQWSSLDAGASPGQPGTTRQPARIPQPCGQAGTGRPPAPALC